MTEIKTKINSPRPVVDCAYTAHDYVLWSVGLLLLGLAASGCGKDPSTTRVENNDLNTKGSVAAPVPNSETGHASRHANSPDKSAISDLPAPAATLPLEKATSSLNEPSVVSADLWQKKLDRNKREYMAKIDEAFRKRRADALQRNADPKGLDGFSADLPSQYEYIQEIGKIEGTKWRFERALEQFMELSDCEEKDRFRNELAAFVISDQAGHGGLWLEPFTRLLEKVADSRNRSGRREDFDKAQWALVHGDLCHVLELWICLSDASDQRRLLHDLENLLFTGETIGDFLKSIIGILEPFSLRVRAEFVTKAKAVGINPLPSSTIALRDALDRSLGHEEYGKWISSLEMRNDDSLKKAFLGSFASHVDANQDYFASNDNRDRVLSCLLAFPLLKRMSIGNTESGLGEKHSDLAKVVVDSFTKKAEAWAKAEAPAGHVPNTLGRKVR